MSYGNKKWENGIEKYIFNPMDIHHKRSNEAEIRSLNKEEIYRSAVIR